MESVYHIVTVRVNETSWAHVWRLRSRYLRTGYDRVAHLVQSDRGFRLLLVLWDYRAHGVDSPGGEFEPAV
jgi:hypothetical protein